VSKSDLLWLKPKAVLFGIPLTEASGNLISNLYKIITFAIGY
jgi:hypothetical protein